MIVVVLGFCCDFLGSSRIRKILLGGFLEFLMIFWDSPVICLGTSWILHDRAWIFW